MGELLENNIGTADYDDKIPNYMQNNKLKSRDSSHE